MKNKLWLSPDYVCSSLHLSSLSLYLSLSIYLSMYLSIYLSIYVVGGCFLRACVWSMPSVGSSLACAVWPTWLSSRVCAGSKSVAPTMVGPQNTQHFSDCEQLCEFFRFMWRHNHFINLAKAKTHITIICCAPPMSYFCSCSQQMLWSVQKEFDL